MANSSFYSITIDDKALRKKLLTLDGKLKNTRPLTAAIAVTMRKAAIEEFQTEGHGEWPANSPATIAASYRGKKKFTKKGAQTKAFQRFSSGKKILTDNGLLRKSLQKDNTVDSATVGSNLRYARIHQLGGFAGRGKKVKIPARPYLNIRPELEKEINDMVEDYFTP